jgi:hypothetical protein
MQRARDRKAAHVRVDPGHPCPAFPMPDLVDSATFSKIKTSPFPSRKPILKSVMTVTLSSARPAASNAPRLPDDQSGFRESGFVCTNPVHLNGGLYVGNDACPATAATRRLTSILAITRHRPPFHPRCTSPSRESEKFPLPLARPCELIENF